MNEREHGTGWIYRLPKEAEWEYACRGGPLDRRDSGFNYYFDKPSLRLLPDQANYRHDKSPGRTCKVGSYRPNVLGLFDMHGNVWEWCDDELKNEKGESSRPIRSGAWDNLVVNCRANSSYPESAPSSRGQHLGLRLARVPVGKEIVRTIIPAQKKPPVESKSSSAIKNALGMEFVLVPKGKAWLGRGWRKLGDTEVEMLHEFCLGKYEVTQEEWEKVTGLNPSMFKAVPAITKEDQKQFPVEWISWGGIGLQTPCDDGKAITPRC